MYICRDITMIEIQMTNVSIWLSFIHAKTNLHIVYYAQYALCTTFLIHHRRYPEYTLYNMRKNI